MNFLWDARDLLIKLRKDIDRAGVVSLPDRCGNRLKASLRTAVTATVQNSCGCAQSLLPALGSSS